MIATQSYSEISLDEETGPWTAKIADLFDAVQETPVWDDWGVVDVLRGEIEERDKLLSGLVRLTACSISGYLELLEFSTDSRLRCFAEVLVRQRAAQCQQLQQLIDRERTDAAHFQSELSDLETAWRMAIWNFEQDRQLQFVEFTEKAESLLEDAFLAAANSFQDADWSREMNDHAVTVCGARSVWEELGNDLVDYVLVHDAISEDSMKHVALAG